MTIELVTVDYADATVGKLIYKGLMLAETLELPNKENQRNISCIPEGVYRIEIDLDVIRLYDVPGRKGILIHSGNTLKDTKGCILVGNLTYDFAQKNERRFKLENSKITLQTILNILRNNKFTHIKITRK